MSSPEARAEFGHEGIESLFLWHALEESEHKAVAFDVYRAIGGSERTRILTMKAARYGFVLGVSFQVALSLLRDPASREKGRLRASFRSQR